MKFAALYWEEPDHSGHMFGPDNDTAMSKVLKEVQYFGYCLNLRETLLIHPDSIFP